MTMEEWLMTLLYKIASFISILPYSVEQVLTTPSVAHQSPPHPGECREIAWKQEFIFKSKIWVVFCLNTHCCIPTDLSRVFSKLVYAHLNQLAYVRKSQGLLQCLWIGAFLPNTSAHFLLWFRSNRKWLNTRFEGKSIHLVCVNNNKDKATMRSNTYSFVTGLSEPNAKYKIIYLGQMNAWNPHKMGNCLFISVWGKKRLRSSHCSAVLIKAKAGLGQRRQTAVHMI